ncbi:MAG: nucleoside triphosphate pyrophosphatase [Rhodospirillales bacterium]|jgi:septum formation protein|nr:nucleoside triphosphate pyrophosphatase [Rhodospirillales bacterium]MDP6882815.1 nucleoside triphosphate pyrophosphatase [Rhodospirillales bacterium]
MSRTGSSHDRPRLILASESPRRRDLLKQIGIVPDQIVSPQVDETQRPEEKPAALAARLAEAKARAIAAPGPRCLVLGADTVVACGRRVLPKSADADEARRALALLSGRRHRVLGGVCVIDGDARARHRLVTTIVSFKRLEAREIEQYIASDEWRGKAGGYAVQGRAAVFISKVIGSYSNIVGLPLFETAALLHGLGYSADGRG